MSSLDDIIKNALRESNPNGLEREFDCQAKTEILDEIDRSYFNNIERLPIEERTMYYNERRRHARV